DSASTEIRRITNLVRQSLMNRIKLHDEDGRGRRVCSARDAIMPASGLVKLLERSSYIARNFLKISRSGCTGHPDVATGIYHDSSAEVAGRDRELFRKDLDGADRTVAAQVRCIDQRIRIRYRSRLVRIEFSDECVASLRSVPAARSEERRVGKECRSR